jgi:hypothetical protein
LPKIRKKRWKIFDCFCIAIGLLSISVGGPWTTYGWNLRDNHQQKLALFIACIRNWKYNDYLIPFCHFNAKDKATLSERYSYPLFQVNSFEAAGNSALLNPNREENPKIIDLFLKYELSTKLMQIRLNHTNLRLNLLGFYKPFNEHKMVNDSNEVGLFLESHLELFALFTSEEYCPIYKIALKNLPEDYEEFKTIFKIPDFNEIPLTGEYIKKYLSGADEKPSIDPNT